MMPFHPDYVCVRVRTNAEKGTNCRALEPWNRADVPTIVIRAVPSAGPFVSFRVQTPASPSIILKPKKYLALLAWHCSFVAFNCCAEISVFT